MPPTTRLTGATGTGTVAGRPKGTGIRVMTSVRFASPSPRGAARTTIMLAVLAAVVLLFPGSRRAARTARTV